jgi:hypothetical protein
VESQIGFIETTNYLGMIAREQTSSVCEVKFYAITLLKPGLNHEGRTSN